MFTVRLFCAGGMSTSLLVTRMEAAAAERNLEVSIAAFPEADIDRQTEGADVALLGPQVGYKLNAAKKICDPKGVPVAVIPMKDYGMMNSENVLKFALDLKK